MRLFCGLKRFAANSSVQRQLRMERVQYSKKLPKNAITQSILGYHEL